MQIIKLWLKLTAILAIIGWAMHTFSPGFAAWVDGVFDGKETQTTEVVVQKPVRTVIVKKQNEEQPVAKPVYRLNE